MKLQLIKAGEETIQGFHSVEVNNGACDLGDVSDNECEFILASDILDEVPQSKFDSFISLLLSKLRLNGVVCLGGTDVRLLCSYYNSGLLSVDEVIDIFEKSKSLSVRSRVVDLLKRAGLTIASVSQSGITFEVTAKREVK